MKLNIICTKKFKKPKKIQMDWWKFLGFLKTPKNLRFFEEIFSPASNWSMDKATCIKQMSFSATFKRLVSLLALWHWSDTNVLDWGTTSLAAMQWYTHVEQHTAAAAAAAEAFCRQQLVIKRRSVTRRGRRWTAMTSTSFVLGYAHRLTDWRTT